MNRGVQVLVVPLASSLVSLGAAMTLKTFGASQMLFLFVPAVMISAWYGARTGSLVATAISVLLQIAFVLPRDRGSLLPSPGDGLSLLMFTGVCISIGFVTADRRRAKAASCRDPAGARMRSGAARR
jgi:K+-sensing histidine kinase KdpD